MLSDADKSAMNNLIRLTVGIPAASRFVHLANSDGWSRSIALFILQMFILILNPKLKKIILIFFSAHEIDSHMDLCILQHT